MKGLGAGGNVFMILYLYYYYVLHLDRVLDQTHDNRVPEFSLLLYPISGQNPETIWSKM